MRAPLLLLLLTLAAFWPFLDFPEWRGTEARRVQIAAEMVQTGDYIVPRLWGEPTFAKPPFYYWTLAASFHVFGVSTWSARLPSALAFFLLAWLTLHFLSRWFDAAAAWLGAVGVLASPVVMHDAPFAEIDPLFAALTAAALLVLTDGVFRGSRKLVAIAGVLGGLAVLTKGPPFLMFFVAPLFLWWKRNRLRGITVFLVPVVAFYAVYKYVLDGRMPKSDADEVAVAETLGRLAFWRGDLLAIPEHVLVSLLVIGAPFSFWWWRWWRDRKANRGSSRMWRSDFVLLGALSGMAVLVFSKDRSTRYLLPAVPMVIAGLAPYLSRPLQDESAPPRAMHRLACSLGIAGGVLLLAWPWLPFPYPGFSWIAMLALGGIGMVVHSRGQLVRYAVIAPVFFAWPAFQDREDYARTALDFTPTRAVALAAQLQQHGVRTVETDGHVGTSILLATKEALDGRLDIAGDYEQRRPARRRYVLVVDRGRGKLDEKSARDLARYRDVLRVQISRSKSLSLRERR